MPMVWSGLAPEILERLTQLNAEERSLPLVSGRRADRRAAELLRQPLPALESSRSPEGAMAGLWLMAGDWERAHEIAQDLGSVEGSYWHAIVHRMEPDDWNSGYWFRRVGMHPIFPELREQAAALAGAAGNRWRPAPQWDPLQFIAFCEQVRRNPGSPDEVLAESIQRVEWNLLFRWCAASA